MAVIYQDTTQAYKVDAGVYKDILKDPGLAIAEMVTGAINKITEGTFSILDPAANLMGKIMGGVTRIREVNKEAQDSQQEYWLESEKQANSGDKETTIIIVIAVVFLAVLLVKKNK